VAAAAGLDRHGVVAALAGSAFYGLVALVEARLTFWHPSQRITT
jgi:NitT/TauT family transport system permease protein